MTGQGLYLSVCNHLDEDFLHARHAHTIRPHPQLLAVGVQILEQPDEKAAAGEGQLEGDFCAHVREELGVRDLGREGGEG